MGRTYIFLADGFEEIEGLTVVDIFRRGGAEITTVSITGSRTVHGAHGIDIQADALFEDTDFSDASLLVLPGGMPGTIHLGEHKALCDLLVRSKAEGRKLAAICAAPSVLGKLGLLDTEKATANPNFMGALGKAETSEERVVVSGQVTTSRGMGTAIPFALELLKQLKGLETAEKTAKNVVWTF